MAELLKTQTSWRIKGIGVVRILFGLIWVVDAWFKWQPDFIHRFTDYLTGALDGQPAAVQAWINFWINFIKVDPHLFAYVVAVAETLVAIGLIFGVFSNLTNLGGGAFVARHLVDRRRFRRTVYTRVYGYWLGRHLRSGLCRSVPG